IDDLAGSIEADAAMTAKLLQLVNSAFFGLSNKITDVRHAMSYLGLETVRNLLTAVELTRGFTAPSVELVQAVESLQTHSLAVAELARTLMQGQRGVHDAFAAGIMHDIGLLALIAHAPEKYLELRKTAIQTGRMVADCEEEVL